MNALADKAHKQGAATYVGMVVVAVLRTAHHCVAFLVCVPVHSLIHPYIS